MSRFARFSLAALLLAVSGGGLGACQALAGIEDRTFDPAENGGTSQECLDYCAQARTVCNGQLYRTDEACLGVCANLPPEGVACRARQLDNAVQTGEDLGQYCASAGPGGNGTCGSNCESYCTLFAAACSPNFEKYNNDAADGDGIKLCVAKCQGLTDTRLFDATNAGMFEGDTLQCRLVHVSSATVTPDLECAQAELKSAKCVDDPAEPADCDTYCRLEMAECNRGNDFPVYEDEAQCQAVCHALPLGKFGDMTQNTIGCRRYHSYNSLLDPVGHCGHTGPGGDGHCGTNADPASGNTGNCESYCILLERACQADFDKRFASQEECQASCVKIDGAGPSLGYTIAAEGDNVQCRLLHVSRALTEATECAAAQGAAPCK